MGESKPSDGNGELAPRDHYVRAMQYLDRAEESRDEVYASRAVSLAEAHLRAADVGEKLQWMKPRSRPSMR